MAAVATYVLMRARLDAIDHVEATAERMSKQLVLQLVRISTSTDLPERFPDAGVFDPQYLYGLCARYVNADGDIVKSVCRDMDPTARRWPHWFESAYRWIFGPAREVRRTVKLHKRQYGAVVVAPFAEAEIARAWQAVHGLLGLTALTIVALCLMAYASLVRMLLPAAQIVSGLKRIKQGDLAYRLPAYELVEFQKFSSTINHLAENLEQTNAARRELSTKLLNAHEEERRYLTRELHDEIGQCLAGIRALSVSIAHTAERECPRLVPEAEQISDIVEHMLGLVQNLLTRLRPPELDTLGLSECLRRLVQGWNSRSAGRTSFELDIGGMLDAVPAALSGHLYRLVQESLSNASKHAEATHVQTRITITPDVPTRGVATGRVELVVEDDGIATVSPAEEDYGIGLRGMKDRVTALGGRWSLEGRAPSGLILRVLLPVSDAPVQA